MLPARTLALVCVAKSRLARAAFHSRDLSISPASVAGSTAGVKKMASPHPKGYESSKDGVRLFVQERLEEIEKHYGVKVIYAVEHSSQIWGTANKGSDWDVKMVYCYPFKRYFTPRGLHSSINRSYGPGNEAKKKGATETGKPEMFDLGLEVDFDVEITGWDVTQFNKMVKNIDNTAMEMVVSPIVHFESGQGVYKRTLMNKLQGLSSQFCHPLQLATHSIAFARSLHSSIKESKGKFANMGPGKKEYKYIGYMFRKVLNSHALLSSHKIADAPLHWADLCKLLERITTAEPRSVSGADRRITAEDIQHVRAFFSKFSLEDEDFCLTPQEKGKLLQVAGAWLEDAQDQIKALCDSDEKVEGEGKTEEDDKIAAFEDAMASWALECITSLHGSAGLPTTSPE